MAQVKLPPYVEARIRRSGGHWLWTGTRYSPGYGYAWFEGRGWYAHRLVYTLLCGAIPPKRQLHHRCKYRECVNPEHLEVVTQKEHSFRHGHGLATHCRHGHEYTRENTALVRGIRRCRTCGREASRKSYALHGPRRRKRRR